MILKLGSLQNLQWLNRKNIDELHEFLLVEEKEKQSEIYELRKVYA
jgi:hypothetical protein